MFCSIVIPTVGRPTLTRTVESVLGQSLDQDEFEIIVVNDSGQPLAPAAWQQSGRVQVVNSNRRERSVARNTGAALARGQYLHFLDDDDWLLPTALEQLRDVTLCTPTARWVYGGSQLVDRANNPLIQLRHTLSGNCFVQVMAGEWIPIQASLVESKLFFAIGGFSPFLSVGEDVDLCRRVALRGDVAGTQDIVVQIEMGVERSTTDYAGLAQFSRAAREAILNEPGVFARLRASARSSYWHGRVARAYLTSVVWNLRQRRWFVALSRLGHGVAGVALAGAQVASAGFWQALLKNYQSEAFRRGFEEKSRQRVLQTG